ncbi:MAG: hypothetical protein IPN01_36495 [Deltaproteobacteria bacterium]|nr:hypothetical protein [Deltaproteobacteria bacterium]
MRDLVDADEFEGVYDLTDPQNPFVDWYHVIVPYCTGDIHWGDAVTTYGEGEDAVTIEHKGAVNTRAILDWVESQFSGPEQIVVTGCSAGAYGSAMWAPHIQRMYPNAQVNQIGDGGAGVVTTDFFANSFPRGTPPRPRRTGSPPRPRPGGLVHAHPPRPLQPRRRVLSRDDAQPDQHGA